jgi:lipoate-protein ligase B
MGLVEYSRAWDYQKALMDKVRAGQVPGTLILLEHPHVYTLGRRGRESDVLADEVALERLGVAIHHVDRGGEATYHGPGQLVAYPILDLRGWGGGPVKYVRGLEDVLIRTLGDFGISAHRQEGLPGVWAGDGKIAFVGVRISGGVTCHGISLNVNADLSFYDHIVPCGMPRLTVTSVERLPGKPVDMEAVKRAFVSHFGRVMGLDTILVPDLEGVPGRLD